MSKPVLDPVEEIETAGSGETTVVVSRPQPPPLVADGRLAERSKRALDMLALGSRKIAKYETLLGRLVGEIGRFAEAARRERTQLENEVRSLKQELAALRKDHAATEQNLINSQLDCWALRMRIQAMKDARTMFDGLKAETRTERPPGGRVIDLD